MPPGGTPARAQERSRLASHVHEAWTGAPLREAIEAARAAAGTPEEEALVREAARVRKRRVRVPDALVEELAEATSQAHPAWVQAKRKDRFEAFAPHLEHIVELRRRYADAIGPDRDAYEVLFEDHEPWLDWATCRRVLARLAEGLEPLVEAAPPAGKQPRIEGRWPRSKQRGLMRELLDELGYDFQRGRLDESEHPFSTGNPHDARITTSLDEGDLLTGITSTVHEFGHALYTQNLPRERLGTPLGQARDLVVHEANARFWENHVARSRGFWERWAPRIEERFGAHLDAETAWSAANRVHPSPVRVDADEVTYHLHVVLRTEIEQALIEGSLDVDEAPGAWNDRMEELLGLRPRSDGEGILQDVHWSHGSFGYFPTYSLGSLLAAQLAARIEADVADLSHAARQGSLGGVRAWLEESVHRHGQRFTTPDLIEHAAGARLTEEPFLEHARAKITAIRRST